MYIITSRLSYQTCYFSITFSTREWIIWQISNQHYRIRSVRNCCDSD